MRGRDHQHQPGIAVIDHEGLQLLLLGGKIDAMVEIAGHHVGTAAEHGFERIRAALEVDQFDRDARLLVFAKLFRQYGRQVAQAAAATDGDGDLALGRGGAADQGQRQQRAREPAQDGLHDVLPLLDGNDNAAQRA